ncbi:hypothetical protein [Pantanalinema sp. GBBB05]|uniref:hypothetical protein n=1 Tax=Pantanalinema sp. GBBB05 TaxID=2604139 RepID=UPI001DDBE3E3|nr:hypothetical protein [Pantanalinema sp. GBBB05]
MDLAHIAIQLVVAIGCATLGNILIPRRIPGRFFGLIVTGLVGVWLGEGSYQLLQRTFKLNLPWLHFNLMGVPIIPSIIGSMIVIYLVTTLLRWGRYSH